MDEDRYSFQGLPLPEDIVNTIKYGARVIENDVPVLRDGALVKRENAPKYYVDLTYRNPNINSPAKVKNTLEQIRFLDPNDNDSPNAFENMFRIVRDINRFTGVLGQGAQIQYHKQKFRENADILRHEHNLNNDVATLVQNNRIERLFQETFGGNLFDENSWDTVYNNLIQPTRIDFAPGKEIEYNTPLTQKSANKIKGAMKRAIIRRRKAQQT